MKHNIKLMIALALVAMGSLSTWAADSEPGHWLYFQNTNNAWANVYLRIGRADHVYTKAFTRIGDSNWWKCETPDYKNYTHFTITNSSDATAPVTTYKNGIYRLYEESYNLKADHWFVLTDGPNANDNHFYWNNTSHANSPITKQNASEGKLVYYDNSQSQWTNVYLRIGRSEALGMGAHTATWSLTQIEGTDYWYMAIPEGGYSNAQAWTITDTDANNGDNYSIYDLPANANRLYYYHTSINNNVYYAATSATAQGISGTGLNYWDNTSTQPTFSVYLVPSYFFTDNWPEDSKVKLEIKAINHVGSTQEIEMTPISSGAALFSVNFSLPFPMAYELNFKRYTDSDWQETYVAFYNDYKSASIWNGKIYSNKNDARTDVWFDYPAPQISLAAGSYIFFDNSATQWENVYLRIGRNLEHGYDSNWTSSRPFSRLGSTDMWMYYADEAFENAEAWTITNLSQDAGGNDRPLFASEGAADAEGLQRTYYYRENISGDVFVTPIGSAPVDGTDPFGKHFWASGKSASRPSFTIRFLNDDATVLQSNEVPYGATPSYTEPTPSHPGDPVCTYTFEAWSPAITAVTDGPKDYTATYSVSCLSEYSRTVTAGDYGTICLPLAASSYEGLIPFRLVDKTAEDGIIIEEVDAMEAGKPYIFMADADQVNVTFTGDPETARSVNGLVGYIGNEDLILEPEGENRYILAQNKIWMLNSNVRVPSNRAYIDMSQIASLPHKVGKRRYVISGKGESTAIEETGVRQPSNHKWIQNGQLFIQCDQHIYNTQGQRIH